MTLADEIILSLIYQHIGGKERFGIIGKDASLKTVIGCFHVSVSMVNADDTDPV